VQWGSRSLEFAGGEGNSLFAVNDSLAFIPPGGIGIAHDLAAALVEQQQFDRAKERKDSKLIARISEPWKPSD
jgi:hypothetical protein